MAPYEPAMSADSFGARWRYFIHSSVSGLTAWRGGQRRVRLEDDWGNTRRHPEDDARLPLRAAAREAHADMFSSVARSC